MTDVQANTGAVFDLINNETHDESHQIQSPEQPPVENDIQEQDEIREDIAEQVEQAEQAEQADQGNQEEHELKGEKNLVAEVEEPQTAAYSNAENNETQVNLNTAEVKTELYALHEKVDKVLGRYVIPQHTYELGTLVQPITAYTTPVKYSNLYSMTSPYGDTQHFEFIEGNSSYTDGLTHYNNPFSASKADGERVLRSSVKSHYTTVEHDRKPSYDVEKLDKIISRIVGAPIRTSYKSTSHIGRESIGTIQPVRESFKDANLNHSMTTQEIFLASGSTAALAALGTYAKKIGATSSPNVRFSSNTYSPVRESYREVERVKKSAPRVQQVQQEHYFCGEVENDADSLVMDHMEDHAHEMEAKKDQYTNHYVGNLADDADEVPRTKRVGKRQQAINSRKGDSISQSTEFVKKGAYEQKNKEQVNASQAERYFERDANNLGDFDFNQK